MENYTEKETTLFNELVEFGMDLENAEMFCRQDLDEITYLRVGKREILFSTIKAGEVFEYESFFVFEDNFNDIFSIIDNSDLIYLSLDTDNLKLFTKLHSLIDNHLNLPETLVSATSLVITADKVKATI